MQTFPHHAQAAADALDPLEPIVREGHPAPVRLARLAEKLLSGPRACVTSALGSSSALLLAHAARAPGVRFLCVAPDLDAAERLAQDLQFFLGAAADRAGAGSPVVLFAPPESTPWDEISPDRRAGMNRVAALFRLAHDPAWRFLVAPAPALVRKVIPRSALDLHTARVVAETEIDRDELARALSGTGYLRAPLVEDPGSFAVRGAVVDVWPAHAQAPLRVELYGDMVVSVRPFDPTSQTTLKDHAFHDLWLPPAREAILSRENVARARERVTHLAEAIDLPTLRTRALVEDLAHGRAFAGADAFLPAYHEALVPLLDHVPGGVKVALVDPPRVIAELRGELERAEADVRTRHGPVFPVASHYASEEDVRHLLEPRGVVTLFRGAVLGATEGPLAALENVQDADDLEARDHADLARAVAAARATKGKTATLGPLARRIRHFHDHGLSVVVTARAETQADRLATLLRHQGIACDTKRSFDTERPRGEHDVVRIVTGTLAEGLVLPQEGLAIVTEEEIFGARAHKRRPRAAKEGKKGFAFDLSTLAVGDYVVHAEHGIGRYQGLVHRDVEGVRVDLIQVEYAGKDRLYLPVHRLSQLGKYAAGDHGEPKLDRLGGSTFAKTRARVDREVRRMADELLRLYAERKAAVGHALPSPDDDYRAFEAAFAFEETPDQARAIEEVSRDLEADRPMDRLVCGDVGFGKTEVAIRAAFRSAGAGRQVAVLCPTTILAQQHVRVFEARMQGTAFVIRAMSRFQGKKEQEDTLRGLKDGTVDVVVGTHRLLSKDVHYKNLGLLVVDEEQRFGVAHKERIKQLRTTVDVLTLSATPIPRTLQMAVSGIRDLSLITTPPVDRRAVRTLVTRWDPHVVREAVTRELSRGGQVFYVYNRVEGLYERAKRLQDIVPEARIAVAHGQMSTGKRGGDSALERTMLDFVDGRYDVLCATAIVESGLDIPRANTILIDRADLLGLAQLYQLRGRVGRSKERAYCYLVVPPDDAMTDESRARVEALQRHAELGSGFKIASLDLELRGAGDLLGGEQSGNVASVGFEMFCQMLEDAVHELRGETVVHDIDPDLSFDVEALLPEDYVADTGVRLSLYKRLASADGEADVMELAREMEDRFGPPPEAARRLVQLMVLKTELRRLRALGCEATPRQVTLHLAADTPLDAERITRLVRAPRSPWRLTPDMRLSRRFEGGAGSLANAEVVLEELARCVAGA